MEVLWQVLSLDHPLWFGDVWSVCIVMVTLIPAFFLWKEYEWILFHVYPRTKELLKSKPDTMELEVHAEVWGKAGKECVLGLVLALGYVFVGYAGLFILFGLGPEPVDMGYYLNWQYTLCYPHFFGCMFLLLCLLVLLCLRVGFFLRLATHKYWAR